MSQLALNAQVSQRVLTELAFVIVIALLMLVNDSTGVVVGSGLNQEKAPSTGMELATKQALDGAQKTQGGVDRSAIIITVKGDKLFIAGKAVSPSNAKRALLQSTGVTIVASPGLAELLQFASESAIPVLVK